MLHPSRLRAGFTLVESLVALTLMMLAGAAILLSVDATVSTSESSVEETIAAGMAQQLVDEVLGKRYMAENGSPYQWPMYASGWEYDGDGRERFNDTDDFANWSSSAGAEDIWGQRLGNEDGAGGLRHPAFQVNDFFDDWRQEIQLYYLDENDLSVRLADGVTSDYREVEVRISRRNAEGQFETLAVARRVFCYVSAP